MWEKNEFLKDLTVLLKEMSNIQRNCIDYNNNNAIFKVLGSHHSMPTMEIINLLIFYRQIDSGAISKSPYEIGMYHITRQGLLWKTGQNSQKIKGGTQNIFISLDLCQICIVLFQHKNTII